MGSGSISQCAQVRCLPLHAQYVSAMQLLSMPHHDYAAISQARSLHQEEARMARLSNFLLNCLAPVDRHQVGYSMLGQGMQREEVAEVIELPLQASQRHVFALAHVHQTPRTMAAMHRRSIPGSLAPGRTCQSCDYDLKRHQVSVAHFANVATFANSACLRVTPVSLSA
jgi:hypothetical protein